MIVKAVNEEFESGAAKIYEHVVRVCSCCLPKQQALRYGPMNLGETCSGRRVCALTKGVANTRVGIFAL